MRTTTTATKTKKLPRKSPVANKAPKQKVEKETKKVPNFLFLGLAGAAAVGSTLLSLSNNGKRKMIGRFIGMWVPSLLTLGLYNKVVAVENEVLDVVKH